MCDISWFFYGRYEGKKRMREIIEWLVNMYKKRKKERKKKKKRKKKREKEEEEEEEEK